MKLYFVSGAHGSGKSAIKAMLECLVGDRMAVYDFDDIGVPAGADKKWRQESTEKWLKKLVGDNKDACLLGQMVLGEILACPSAQSIPLINFCFLDVDDAVRIMRLKIGREGEANQNTLNWASWLRMHTSEPQWAQHVLKDECWDGLRFDLWDKEVRWSERVRVKTIDTTLADLDEVAEQVLCWIDPRYSVDEWHGERSAGAQTYIIYLIGKPGVGKYSIARELARKHGLVVCDNQLINNPVFELLQYDGHQDIPMRAWRAIRHIRESIFSLLGTTYEKSYVLTNCLGENPGDRRIYQQVEAMAQSRGSLFVPVHLRVEKEEHLRRLTDPQRRARWKSINPKDAEDNGPILSPTHPHALELDTTLLSAEAAAECIMHHVESLLKGDS